RLPVQIPATTGAREGGSRPAPREREAPEEAPEITPEIERHLRRPDDLARVVEDAPRQPRHRAPERAELHAFFADEAVLLAVVGGEAEVVRDTARPEDVHPERARERTARAEALGHELARDGDLARAHEIVEPARARAQREGEGPRRRRRRLRADRSAHRL